MGVFSKFHRYRDAGEEPNVNNVAAFGQPLKSLFTTTKFFTVHHHIDVTDENENIIYQANSKFFTLHDVTEITDNAGNHVASMKRKFLTIHEKHFITMADGLSFMLSTELLHLIKDIINIPELGWQIRGNITALNFEIYDGNGDIIANIGQKMISLHDKYCIDIYKLEYEQIVVAILITIQHMIRDRERSSQSSGSFSHSSD